METSSSNYPDQTEIYRWVNESMGKMAQILAILIWKSICHISSKNAKDSLDAVSYDR